MQSYLDFEKPIAELEGKVRELEHLAGSADDVDVSAEIDTLREKADQLLRRLYENLTPWQKVQVARHPERPQLPDYIEGLIEGFMPLAGDRLYGEDKAVIGGLGRFRGRSVMVIGITKGRSTQTRLERNFGMARPEGYRKAQRLMRLADRFSVPVLTLVDTPGAYPGVGAEERGQAEAIARSIETCLDIRVPLIATIIGEGGSGGAIALAAGNRVFMLEHAVYSVISPEACSSILWKDGANTREAAEALKLTAQDLKRLGIADDVIEEPVGGAQRDPATMVARVGERLEKALDELLGTDGDEIRRQRHEKFLAMGRAV